MPVLGQNAKYSARVDVFRFASELGHCWTRLPLRICAKKRSFDQLVRALLEFRGDIEP